MRRLTRKQQEMAEAGKQIKLERLGEEAALVLEALIMTQMEEKVKAE